MTPAHRQALTNTISALVLNPLTAIAGTLCCAVFLYMLERSIDHMPFVMLSVLGIATVLFLLTPPYLLFDLRRLYGHGDYINCLCVKIPDQGF